MTSLISDPIHFIKNIIKYIMFVSHLFACVRTYRRSVYIGIMEKGGNVSESTASMQSST